MRGKQKIIFNFVFVITCLLCTGCVTGGRKPVESVPNDYIKPATVEVAQYGIDERSAALERILGDCRSEIIGLRESCETIINAGGRSGDLIQDTLEKAEAVYRWVSWAYPRLQYLESLLADQIQD